jgi:glycine hydroxymethyltransferase
MKKNPLREYLSEKNIEDLDSGFIAYLASLTSIGEKAPDVARGIVKELADQRSNLKLIASENYSSIAAQMAMGNLLTDKYAEGFPRHRFYAGCDNVDDIEEIAAQTACRVFGCDHAYVQPHSGADANLVAYWAILSERIETPFLKNCGDGNPSNLPRETWNELRGKLGNQRLLGLDYYSGGHLTHGYRHNVSAQMFDAYSYGVSRETGLLDYDEIADVVKKVRPFIFLAGYSAYPRAINFRKMREIADSVGAVFMVDMAHFAGLVAGGVFTGDFNPVLHADVVTTTTHKTLRGPRGGMVLCRKEFADSVDKGCPLVIGGPLPHVMAAKAVALKEAESPDFKTYAAKIVENARGLSAACMKRGMTIATGGTDNHLFLIDARSFDLSGRQAESALRESGVTLNRNALPYDTNGPWYTSGLRIGTPAVTTLGMGASEMEEIADIIQSVLSRTKPAIQSSGDQAGQTSKAKYLLEEGVAEKTRRRVKDLLSRFTLYPELDLAFLEKSFLR